MELTKRIIELIDANLIFCLIPMILSLMLIELLFINRFETRQVLYLIRWIIIFYTLIIWILYLTDMALFPENYTFFERATGPYKAVYWLMIVFALLIPFTLLFKKLASKFWYVLLVAFAMKIGFYFEHFVIITTSFHADYQTQEGNTETLNSFTFGIGMLFLQGIIITVLSLGVIELIKRKKAVYQG
jgi:hypothetical protein